ncbi:MAG: ParA family protein [Myxococcales bacterium]|nr:ParA family protein [Myxococcales bacterium]
MQKLCANCDTSFVPTYVYQLAVSKTRERQYFCSLLCRQSILGEGGFRNHRAKRIAVLDVVLPVRKNFDVITNSQLLAAAEIWLARQPIEQRSRTLGQRLAIPEISKAYDYVLIDCGPSLNLLNQNALSYANEIIIPVNCDYLSPVGVKQVLGTLRNMEKHLMHTVRLSGVLPTFYDARTKLASEVLETLQDHFKNKCLPAIRSNTKLAEAPSRRRTIFEHAPDSYGAEDYLRIVDWLLSSEQHEQHEQRTTAAA